MNIEHSVTGSSHLKMSQSAMRHSVFQIEAERIADILHNIEIWSDLRHEDELRRIVLSPEVRCVRYFDAANGNDIAEVSDSTGRPFSAYDVADVLTWHVDYRGRTWVSTSVKNLSAHTLDLSIAFSV